MLLLAIVVQPSAHLSWVTVHVTVGGRISVQK